MDNYRLEVDDDDDDELQIEECGMLIALFIYSLSEITFITTMPMNF